MIKTALTKAEILELLETRKNEAWENMKLFSEEGVNRPKIYKIYHREWYEATTIIYELERKGKEKRRIKR